jgi:hypothetical protein
MTPRRRPKKIKEAFEPQVWAIRERLLWSLEDSSAARG